jgi:hypothetical protein
MICTLIRVRIEYTSRPCLYTKWILLKKNPFGKRCIVHVCMCHSPKGYFLTGRQWYTTIGYESHILCIWSLTGYGPRQPHATCFIDKMNSTHKDTPSMMELTSPCGNWNPSFYQNRIALSEWSPTSINCTSWLRKMQSCIARARRTNFTSWLRKMQSCIAHSKD